MQSTQRFSWINFYALTVVERLELLMAQREMLFEHEQALLARQTELTRQQHELLSRRTIHEMQGRLFWLRLRNPTLTKQEDQAETTQSPEHSSISCGCPIALRDV